MPEFSDRSKDKLYEVHPDLITLFEEVVKTFDCTVISGFRTAEEQQELYAKGRTEDGPIVTYKDGIVRKSKHQLGLAVDVVPYPSLYSDEKIMNDFGWYVLDTAERLKKDGMIDSDITWGGSWKFTDMPHFEI
jgi:peptidoglycan L-alanyl-D-glutamate endopeptidase CwlK